MPGNPGRPTKLDQVVRHREGGAPVTVAEHIIECLRAGSYVEEAAADAGVHKSTVYDWQKRGARITQEVEAGTRKLPRAGSLDRQLMEFSDAVADAKGAWFVGANAELERLSRRRTIQIKTTKTKTDAEGKVTTEVTVREHVEEPDSATIRWRMERKDPERYGRQVLELTGPNGGAIPVDVRTAALSKLTEAAAQLAGNAAAVATATAEAERQEAQDDRPPGEPPS